MYVIPYNFLKVCYETVPIYPGGTFECFHNLSEMQKYCNYLSFFSAYKTECVNTWMGPEFFPFKFAALWPSLL
jgi:hypothetical protein